MEGLNLDNILDEQDFNLFNDNEENITPQEPEEKEKQEKQEKQTAEVDPESLFEGTPESVGSEEKNKEEVESPSEGSGTSPNNDFFSSIAGALAEEGILPLDDKTVSDIKTPEDFREAIENYLKSELTAQQQRVTEALNNDVEVDTIRQYEGVLNYLNNLSEDAIRAEDEQGETLRKNLMFQDYINRGFDKKRAEKEVNRSISNGTDIEDALDALEGCKTFYKNSYDSILEEAKETRKQEEEDRKNRTAKFKENILEGKTPIFEGVDLDRDTRQKIFDNITKPVYKDPKTGELYTAIQKYELDNSEEFLAKLGLLFTLTNGFKSIDKLVSTKAKKEVKKGLRDLENRINNTSRDSSGSLRFTSGVDDTETYLGKGIKLAF